VAPVGLRVIGVAVGSSEDSTVGILLGNLVGIAAVVGTGVGFLVGESVGGSVRMEEWKGQSCAFPACAFPAVCRCHSNQVWIIFPLQGELTAYCAGAIEAIIFAKLINKHEHYLDE
jgi:hypothetical protein